MDKKIKPKYGRIKKYGIIGAVAVLIVAAAIFAAGRVGESTYKVAADSITTAEVTQGMFNDFIRVNGHVETGVIVQVSALESGIVEHKWVEEGADVQPGDIIVTLQNPNLRQQILDSESQLAEKRDSDGKRTYAGETGSVVGAHGLCTQTAGHEAEGDII